MICLEYPYTFFCYITSNNLVQNLLSNSYHRSFLLIDNLIHVVYVEDGWVWVRVFMLKNFKASTHILNTSFFLDNHRYRYLLIKQYTQELSVSDILRSCLYLTHSGVVSIWHTQELSVSDILRSCQSLTYSRVACIWHTKEVSVSDILRSCQ